MYDKRTSMAWVLQFTNMSNFLFAVYCYGDDFSLLQPDNNATNWNLDRLR